MNELLLETVRGGLERLPDNQLMRIIDAPVSAFINGTRGWNGKSCLFGIGFGDLQRADAALLSSVAVVPSMRAYDLLYESHGRDAVVSVCKDMANAILLQRGAGTAVEERSMEYVG